jgi:primosomal protein N'
MGQDYTGFFEDEMAFRRAMRYPPVVSLINVVVRGPSAGDAMDLAADLAKRVRQQPRGDACPWSGARAAGPHQR